jgi:hypothetical protein
MPLNGASTKYIYNIFTYLQEAWIFQTF